MSSRTIKSKGIAKSSKSDKHKRSKHVGIARTLGAPGVPAATRGFRSGYGSNPTEKKVVDSLAPWTTGAVPAALAAFPINTTGSFTLLNCPAQGSDYTQRIGRRINNKSVYIRGMIVSNSAAGDTAPTSQGPQLCRMLLLVDLQPNGAVPNVTDVLQFATSYSQLNLNNRDRFKILTDKQIPLGQILISTTATQAYASSNGPQQAAIKKFKNLNFETTFQTSNPSISDVTTGALYLLWIGSEAAGGGAATFNGSVRLRFSDD